LDAAEKKDGKEALRLLNKYISNFIVVIVVIVVTIEIKHTKLCRFFPKKKTKRPDAPKSLVQLVKLTNGNTSQSMICWCICRHSHL
jgi:hypothetical protein